MTPRSIKYFSDKRFRKRLGVTSWHMDWIKMATAPEKEMPQMNLCFMMPSSPFTYADGTIIEPRATPARIEDILGPRVISFKNNQGTEP